MGLTEISHSNFWREIQPQCCNLTQSHILGMGVIFPHCNRRKVNQPPPTLRPGAHEPLYSATA
ncbi:hypothetical protein E2C01_010159 [Portunus trituberculatus]|uniref:Uncharacterized protein n=1 Tax=Portunus trituberculatus TaxID=210409 RepID=A0A5B7D7M5_PORTR|nr:hypothetical protein [Portunus trituberculatus]